MKNNKLFDLNGRVAVVTGGAGLLAVEHAKALNEFGATVILSDINLKKCSANCNELLDNGYTNIHSMECDVTSKKSWEAMTDVIIAKHGKISILVNNAGFTNQSKSANFDADFEDFPLEDWNGIMNVNLTGSFLGCQVVGKHMLSQGKGSIINIGSLYGVVSPNHKMYPGTGIKQPVAYTVSKHGVIALTKFISTLWAEKGVRVNSLTPGGIFNGHKPPFLDRFEQLNPIGRMSKKDELKGGIVYLASDASSHVVGHNLIIDGGWTVW